MLIYSILLAFILVQVNGQTTSQTLNNVPYATSYQINCTGASEWYYVVPSSGVETKIAANDTFIIAQDSLTIKETRKDQLDVDYICVTSSGRTRFYLKPVPFMYALEKSSVTVTEGGQATASCKLIVGFSRGENVTWQWLFNGQPVNSSDSRITVEVTDANSTSKLTIKQVTNLDKGTYACMANNTAGSYNHEIILRVKSTLAALWPFLAIIGEVVILCLIILIFEKKCGKKSSSEAKEEQSDNLLNKQNENSDVKKRAVKA